MKYSRKIFKILIEIVAAICILIVVQALFTFINALYYKEDSLQIAYRFLDFLLFLPLAVFLFLSPKILTKDKQKLSLFEQGSFQYKINLIYTIFKWLTFIAILIAYMDFNIDFKNTLPKYIGTENIYVNVSNSRESIKTLFWTSLILILVLKLPKFIKSLNPIDKSTNADSYEEITKDEFTEKISSSNSCPDFEKENQYIHDLFDKIERKEQEHIISNSINNIRKLWILEPAKDGEVHLYFYDNSIIFAFYSYENEKVFEDKYSMTDTKNIYYNPTYGYLHLLDNNEILEITPREERRYSKVINKIDFLQYEFITEDDPLNRKVLLEKDILNFLDVLNEMLPITYPHNISLTQVTYDENIITLHMTHNEERGTLDNSLRLKKEVISMFLKTNFVKDCIKLKKDIAIQVYSKDREHLFTDSIFKIFG